MNPKYLFSLLMLSGVVSAGQDLDKRAFQMSAFNGSYVSQAKMAREKITQVEYVELRGENLRMLNGYLDELESGNLGSDAAVQKMDAANQLIARGFRDSRLVCNYEQRTGTNIKKQLCMTSAAKNRIHEITRRNLAGRGDARPVWLPEGGGK
jgi:hypothetical protein